MSLFYTIFYPVMSVIIISIAITLLSSKVYNYEINSSYTLIHPMDVNSSSTVESIRTIIASIPLIDAISNSSQPSCTKTNGIQPDFTQTNICQAYNIIKPAFVKLLPNTNDILGRGKLFGSAVRLAFHDAGEYDIRTSDLLGPDGCLSHGPNNRGLQEDTSIVMTVLEPLWQQVCQYITRADFWVMFAKLVIEEATSHSITIAYQYGRHDNSECSVGANRLPSGQSGLTDIEDVFVSQMNLTMSDAGVLLGAHSLGYTNITNTGYGFNDSGNYPPFILNAWDSTPHVLDNNYFIELTQKNWDNVLASVPEKSQWGHMNNGLLDPIIMLNPDMLFAYPIDSNKSKQTITGKRQQCGYKAIKKYKNKPRIYGCKNPYNIVPPESWNHCVNYSINNTLFLIDFAESFTKMTTVGYGIQLQSIHGSMSAFKEKGKLGMLTSINLSVCM